MRSYIFVLFVTLTRINRYCALVILTSWAMHLREDLRDIRSEVRDLHTRIDGTNSVMNTRFDALSARLESHLRTG